MAELITGDCRSMPPNEPPYEGIEAHRAYWGQMLEAGQLLFGTQPRQLEVLGDRAFDLFDFTLDITSPEGETVHNVGKCIWLWSRESDGAWRVSHAIWNSDLPVP